MRCFVSNVIKFGPMDLDEKSNIWKVHRPTKLRTDRRIDNRQQLIRKNNVIWTFRLGDLKIRLLNHQYFDFIRPLSNRNKQANKCCPYVNSLSIVDIFFIYCRESVSLSWLFSWIWFSNSACFSHLRLPLNENERYFCRIILIRMG